MVNPNPSIQIASANERLPARNPNPGIRMSGDDSNLLIANEQGAKQDALDINLAKFIAEALNEHYPGHLWAVNAMGDQGIATIHNLMLSGKWGCNIHLDKRYSISELKATAIRYAGELLERYNVSRGKADYDRMVQMPMDHTGQVIGDTSR